MTLDLGLRHEYYTPFVGIQRQGGLSNYDPVTNQLQVSGYGRRRPTTSASSQTWRNLNLRTGLSYRIDDRQVVRAGYGSSTIPFGDNTYAYNFPVKQNNQFNAANAFIPPPGISMAGGFPAPVVAQIPSNGLIDAGRRCPAAQRRLLLLPDRPEGRPAALVERRLPARAAAPTSPPKWPTSATTARTSSSAST